MDYVLLAISAATQLAALYWGITTPLKEQRSYVYRLRLVVATAIGVLSIAIFAFREQLAKTTSDYDYAYLLPIGAEKDQAVFFFNATHNLDVLDVALRITNGPYQRRDRFDHIREGLQSDFPYSIRIGDWTLDIDAPRKYGKMVQHLIIEEKDGVPTVTFMRVTRKGNHGLRMCQTPRTQLGIPLC
jgi:hypothetical protein